MTYPGLMGAILDLTLVWREPTIDFGKLNWPDYRSESFAPVLTGHHECMGLKD